MIGFGALRPSHVGAGIIEVGSRSTVVGFGVGIWFAVTGGPHPGMRGGVPSDATHMWASARASRLALLVMRGGF